MGWIVSRKVWQHKKVMQLGSQHAWIQAVEMGLTEFGVIDCFLVLERMGILSAVLGKGKRAEEITEFKLG